MLEHMKRMERSGEWFSKSAGERKLLFGFVVLESNMYSSGAISEATAAATQALCSWLLANET